MTGKVAAMIDRHVRSRLSRGRKFAAITVAVLITTSGTAAQTSPVFQTSDAAAISLSDTVRYALERNPQLAAIRAQHGIASAGVVIAKTYPFNPIYQGTLVNARSPGVSNTLPVSHQLTLEVQLFNQQRYRREAAGAALTRTDWEISAQELLFAVNAVRAFDGMLYRQQKLGVAEEFLKLNEKSAGQIKQLVESGYLKPADIVLARAEVNDLLAQVSAARTALVAARREFYRALGVTAEELRPEGTLDRALPAGTVDSWLNAAMEFRPDLSAKRAAVEEAEAGTKLQKADRYGNPQIGPVYETTDSGADFVGVKVQVSLPFLNTRPGDILQAEAKQRQASLTVTQAEIEIRQDVALSAARLKEAADWAARYRTDILPTLERSLKDMEQLFQQGQAGVDVLRVLDVRRKLLRAKDGSLDSLLAYTQSLADLAQAVGDPAIAMGTYLAAPASSAATKKTSRTS